MGNKKTVEGFGVSFFQIFFLIGLYAFHFAHKLKIYILNIKSEKNTSTYRNQNTHWDSKYNEKPVIVQTNANAWEEPCWNMMYYSTCYFSSWSTAHDIKVKPRTCTQSETNSKNAMLYLWGKDLHWVNRSPAHLPVVDQCSWHVSIWMPSVLITK